MELFGLIIPFWVVLLGILLVAFVVWKIIKFAVWVLILIVIVILAFIGIDFLIDIFHSIGV